MNESASTCIREMIEKKLQLLNMTRAPSSFKCSRRLGLRRIPLEGGQGDPCHLSQCHTPAYDNREQLMTFEKESRTMSDKYPALCL